MTTAPLTLRKLPTLLTDCVLVGHAKKADVVFTPRQWFALCTHMMNENPPNFFLMPYQDKNGKAKFAKAYKAKAEDRIQWAWDTITGKAKSPCSIGFYPTNAQRQSRWAAMDFDMHDDDQMGARDFALKAFAILYRQPQLFVALTTSAGDPVYSGWHLFIFTADFFPCDDWTRLLKQVADQIGAPVKSGIVKSSRMVLAASVTPSVHPVLGIPKMANAALFCMRLSPSCSLPPCPLLHLKEIHALYILGVTRGKKIIFHLVVRCLGVSAMSGQPNLQSRSQAQGTRNS
jgi:hypothetical protein